MTTQQPAQQKQYKQRDHLDYPSLTMFQMVKRIADQYPYETAYEFYGFPTTYRGFIRRIERAARAFLAEGIRAGDAVTICLPNIPQALDCFYALNRIGAIANMVHPLSAQSEISFYLSLSESRLIVTADLFYETVEQAVKNVSQPVKIIVARMQDELTPAYATAYFFKKGKDYLKFPDPRYGKTYRSFLMRGTFDIQLPEITFDPERTAVILYSGGTSGVPKGVCLSDLNFNACGDGVSQRLPDAKLYAHVSRIRSRDQYPYRSGTRCKMYPDAHLQRQELRQDADPEKAEFYRRCSHHL